MYHYLVYPATNEKLFYKQCARLEERIAGLKNLRLLEDPDGTLIQLYRHPKGEVDVYNDEDVGMLYVKSGFDLKPYEALLRET